MEIVEISENAFLPFITRSKILGIKKRTFALFYHDKIQLRQADHARFERHEDPNRTEEKKTEIVICVELIALNICTRFITRSR